MACQKGLLFLICLSVHALICPLLRLHAVTCHRVITGSSSSRLLSLQLVDEIPQLNTHSFLTTEEFKMFLILKTFAVGHLGTFIRNKNEKLLPETTKSKDLEPEPQKLHLVPHLH